MPKEILSDKTIINYFAAGMSRWRIHIKYGVSTERLRKLIPFTNKDIIAGIKMAIDQLSRQGKLTMRTKTAINILEELIFSLTQTDESEMPALLDQKE